MTETLPESLAAAVWQFVSRPLLDNPHRVGERLRFELDGYHSARRGQYRVIYRIDEHEVIVVIKISPRGRLHVAGWAVAPGHEGCQIERFAHAVFPSTCAELVEVTGGELADVA